MLADELAPRITSGPLCLGLATGSSPLPLYAALVAQLQAAPLPALVTWNLDEYLGLPDDHPQSYRRFMLDNLFSHLNGLDMAKTHFPPLAADDKTGEYDELIRQAGGIDIQILGIGSNGHIGFNEPGSSIDSRTRVVSLTQSTRESNARFFDGRVEDTPSQAVSMGLATILEAKEIHLIATGGSKKEIMAQLLAAKGFDAELPASCLINHPNVTIWLDHDAAGTN